MLPPDLREWLLEEHLAWFVLAAVEEMDVWGLWVLIVPMVMGALAHDPAMVLALLLYGYCRVSAPRAGSSARAWRMSPTV